jgi:uncharacterized NAD(P)/FAD-binding protein YdhS
MPPQLERQVLALERDGRLQRLRGRVAGARPFQGRVELQAWHAGARTPLLADIAIQTVGLDTDLRNTVHPLMRQLVTNGHVTPDPLGLGCQAMPDGRLCHEGTPWPRLFGLGSLLRSARWESIAMPEIRLQARMLASQMLEPASAHTRRRIASQAG